MLFDHEFWKHWEGQRIEAKFTLERLTHCDGTRAAFETQFRERAALIQFFTGSPDEIVARRKGWRESAGLSHPSLVEVFERGETAVNDTPCGYIVTERPDDNLNAVLSDRPLTAAEARDMLTPLLNVMRYLHDRGFSHGELKPANIMAFGDQLKVSSDSLTPGGDTASDCTAIGELVKQVLGGVTPSPFAEIVKGSASGWTVANMEDCLQGRGEGLSASRWKMGALAAAALVGVVSFWPASTPPSPPEPQPAPIAETQPVVKPAPSIPPPEPKPVVKPAPSVPPPADPPPPKPAPAKTVPVQNLDGVSQVMPDIPRQARNTITGRVRINVRVNVDGEGRVTQAALDSRGVSQYFGSRVLNAARAWKFPAGQAPSEWLLRFELMRVDTRVSVAKAR